jgi:hypothetical protein
MIVDTTRATARSYTPGDPLRDVFLPHRPHRVERSSRREGAVRFHEVEQAKLGYTKGSSSMSAPFLKARIRHVVAKSGWRRYLLPPSATVLSGSVSSAGNWG